MLRKLYISAGLAIAAVFGLNAALSVSLNPVPNAWLIEQQRIVQDQGDRAPLLARAANAFTRLPTDLLNISRANAQVTVTTPSQNCDQCALRGHVSVGQTSRPAVTAATVTSGSTDYRGRLTAPTVATVTVTFGTAFAAAPWCDVVRSDGSSTAGHAWTVSTTALTITSVTTGAGVVMNWRCDGVMP